MYDVCMFVYVYAHVCICRHMYGVCVYMCMSMCTYGSTCMYMYIYAHVCICMYVCMYLYVYVYVLVYE